MLQELSKELKISSVAHLILVGMLLFAGYLIGRFFRSTSDNFLIAQKSVRVDLVAMPKLTFKELQHIDLKSVKNAPSEVEDVQHGNAQQAQEEQKSEQTVTGNEFQVEKKKEDFLSMLKDISKKEAVVGKDKNAVKKPKISSKLKGEIEQIILAGNQLSKGSAVTGDLIEQENSLFVKYLEGIPDVIRPFWKLPSYFHDQNLRCRIRIYLGKNGKVLRREILESSGDREYDKTAMEAIDRASPLPSVPPEIIEKIISNGIILGFPL